MADAARFSGEKNSKTGVRKIAKIGASHTIY